MMLHGSPLAVELVVDGPGELLLGAVETAPDGRTQPLDSALRETEDVSLREHGG